MKINWKKLVISVLIPLGLGIIVGLLSGSQNGYKEMITPSFAPPGILFPIVWTILYVLMGVSSYMVSESGDLKKEDALRSYYLQLGVNLLWSFIFFTFKLYLLSFIWIILLIGLVVMMILKFYRINKVSAYIEIPYLLWITFAAALNFSIYLLN